MDDLELEASRRALLKYYNSQTMTHGGYIIALVIGVLTTISRLTTFYENSTVWNAFLLLLLYLLAMLIYIVLRTFAWGYFAYEVLNAAPSKKEEGTVMFRLHLGTKDKLIKRNKILKSFLKLSLKLKIGTLIVVPLIFWFILLFLISHI